MFWASARGRLVVLLVGLALVVAACGDDTSTSTTEATATTAGMSVQEEAQALVDAASAALTEFPAPGPGFDANEADGMTVWLEQYSASSATTGIWREALIEAITPYGVTVIPFDGQGQIAEQSRGIDLAIAQGVDVIILSGINPESVAAKVAEAAQAGIPIIVGSNGVAEIPTTENIAAFVTIDHARVGTLLADAAVAYSGEDANVQMITHTSVMGTDVIVDSMEAELARLCPECPFAAHDLPFSAIQTLPELAQTFIVGNPGLTHIVPVYDWETLNMIEAVQAASDTVTLASFNANPDVLQAIVDGAPISADVGNPNEWVGWAYADQALRLMLGMDPVADERIPLRLFTAANIGSLDLAAGETAWYGAIDFKAEFRALWSGA